MFRSGHVHDNKDVNILFNNGGLGDQIARMPAVKYLNDNYPIKINLFVPDYFYDLAKNFMPELNVIKYSNIKENWKPSSYFREFRKGMSNLKQHLTDNAFTVICENQVNIQHKNYLRLDLKDVDISRFNLPDKYVVITTGYTAPVREFSPPIVNDIILFLKNKNITPVFLGSKESLAGENIDKIIGSFSQSIKYELGLDLIDQTSILEAAKVIEGSKAIVGLDNGLIHLAGCLDTPIIAGYTTVDPMHRLPYRNNLLGDNCYMVVPDESLACRFCQSNWDFIANHDFKYCYYKDYKCVKKTPSNKYIQHLKTVLS